MVRLRFVRVVLCACLSVRTLRPSNDIFTDFVPFCRIMAPKKRLLEPWQLQQLAAIAEKEKAEGIQTLIGRDGLDVACK